MCVRVCVCVCEWEDVCVCVFSDASVLVELLQCLKMALGSSGTLMVSLYTIL